MVLATKGVTGRPDDSHILVPRYETDPEVIQQPVKDEPVPVAPHGEPLALLSGVHVPRRRYSWIILLCIGLLIAVVAAVVGGLVGKTIEHNKYSPTQTSRASSAIPIASSTTGSTTGSTALPTPTTGCPDISGKTLQSDNINATYTIYCNVDWVGSDIAGISADSPSICVEACATVNSYNHTNRQCKGATYVPSWINTTAAVEAVQVPANCFLKYNVDGLPSNKFPFEVVVLQMDN